MGKPHTIIGAERFHFRVRDGIGWDPNAIVAGRTGVLLCWPFGANRTTNLGSRGPMTLVIDLLCTVHINRYQSYVAYNVSSTTTAWVLYGQASRAISTG